MKRFTILLTSLICVLAFLAVFQAWSDAQAEAKQVFVPAKVYDATSEMLKAVHAGDNQLMVPATGSDAAIAPVYDATGAMLEAINPDKKVVTFPAYDATGAMWEAINP